MMRYLKSFYESVDYLQAELDDVCDQFLAPLEEEGFMYEVKPAWPSSIDEFEIRLFMPMGNSLYKLFDYSLVMDRFIPLVRILSRRYQLSDWIYFYSPDPTSQDKKIFSVDQICDGQQPDFLVTTVKLTVKGKKQ